MLAFLARPFRGSTCKAVQSPRPFTRSFAASAIVSDRVPAVTDCGDLLRYVSERLNPDRSSATASFLAASTPPAFCKPAGSPVPERLDTSAQLTDSKTAGLAAQTRESFTDFESLTDDVSVARNITFSWRSADSTNANDADSIGSTILNDTESTGSSRDSSNSVSDGVEHKCASAVQPRSEETLLTLPADVYSVISDHLPLHSVAKLQATCKAMYKDLHSHGFIQHLVHKHHLQQYSYQMMMIPAQQAVARACVALSCCRLQVVMNSGSADQAVQDLCRQAAKLSMRGHEEPLKSCLFQIAHLQGLLAKSAPMQLTVTLRHLKAVLLLVFFFFYHVRDLTQGVAVLIKVMALLPEMVQRFPESSKLFEARALVASWLTDMLCMRTLKPGFLCPKATEALLKLGDATNMPVFCPSILVDTRSMCWNDSWYTWKDFQQALTLLAAPGVDTDKLICEEYEDPQAPATQMLLNSACVEFLHSQDQQASLRIIARGHNAFKQQMWQLLDPWGFRAWFDEPLS